MKLKIRINTGLLAYKKSGKEELITGGDKIVKRVEKKCSCLIIPFISWVLTITEKAGLPCKTKKIMCIFKP